MISTMSDIEKSRTAPDRVVPRLDNVSVLISVAVGLLTAAAATLGIYLGLHYLCYWAILHTGGTAWSAGGQWGLFVEDQFAGGTMDWLLVGYYWGGLVVALGCGVITGYWMVTRIRARTVPRADSNNPGVAGERAHICWRAVGVDLVAGIVTVAASGTIAVMVFTTLVAWPLAITALSKSVFSVAQTSASRIDAVTVNMALLLAVTALFVVPRPISMRVHQLRFVRQSVR